MTSIFESSPFRLSDVEIRLIVGLWEDDIFAMKGEKVPKHFRQLMEYLLTYMDNDGVYFMTIQSLASESNIPIQAISNIIKRLRHEGLVVRQTGLLQLNTKAFNPLELTQAKKEFLE